MRKRKKHTNNDGFTLIELMISLVISAFVLTAIYATYQSQQKSFIVQEQVAGMQQNLRAGMYVMQDEIRMAGYDPTLTITPTITAARNNTITFQRDDGTGTTTTDTYIYSYNNGNRTLDRNLNGAGAEPIAENILALGFAYAFDTTGDGDTQLDLSPNGHIIWAVDTGGDSFLDTSIDDSDDGEIDINDTIAGVALTDPYYGLANVPIADIRAVKVWVLARTDQEDKDFHFLTTYVVGWNQRITPNNSFRHRLLTTTIRCRNLEILNNG